MPKQATRLRFSLQRTHVVALDRHAVLGVLRATLPSTSPLDCVYSERLSKRIRESSVVGSNRQAARNDDHGRAGADSSVADRRTIGRGKTLDFFHLGPAWRGYSSIACGAASGRTSGSPNDLNRSGPVGGTNIVMVAIFSWSNESTWMECAAHWGSGPLLSS